MSRIVNGATRADADTVWSCKMGKEPYDVAPLQIFADSTGIGYAAEGEEVHGARTAAGRSLTISTSGIRASR